MPISIEHRQHVRVDRRLPVLAAEKSEGEADEFLLVESPDENVARSLAGNRQRQGQSVIVRHPPDFFLHRFQLAEVVDALEVADYNLLRSAARHHGWPFARFEFGSQGMAIFAQKSQRKSGAKAKPSCTALVVSLSTAIEDKLAPGEKHRVSRGG